MRRTFADALEHRRSYYSISNTMQLPAGDIVNVIKKAVKNVPSAFNSQSTRIVLLMGNEHRKLWNIVKETVKPLMSDTAFTGTEAKIDSCFAGGYGTILYYEDMDVVKSLQETYPIYSDNFPIWSVQTSAMHQLVIWTMLSDLELGASLQHYNPLIDERVAQTWNIPRQWKLIAEMPFGTPTAQPDKKDFMDVDSRIKIFG